ncbi:uncharacterized protein LOC100117440 [Nasonia vitripennis]|uniref:Uncharacterized protein n=1 Tax=Nasonia vitripennis TaxID=7425 RepID=A0A7M7G2T4_NASVI|nr:uncharacterized protein LOC100117440 [Nasonia vitripennis]
MNCQVRLLIYKKAFIYDDLLVESGFVYDYKRDYMKEQIKLQESTIDDNLVQQKINFQPISLRKRGLNAYLVSVYTYTMHWSNVYRKSAVDLLLRFVKANATVLNTTNFVILIKLRTPKYQYLDYGWNERITQMVMERHEIDHAMSWLSTLGGAFSALGDQFNHCAQVAGKISVQQFRLSVRLGDPQLVARCKLYAALSLLQQGYLKVTKHMVRDIYKFAITDKDTRLQKMCQGVWAKLTYCYSQRRVSKRQSSRYISTK